MSDIFREVDEMMQRERAAAFWKKNGSAIITGAVALVVLTGVYSGYQSWNRGVSEAQTKVLIEALEKSDFAEKAGDIAPDLRPGLRGVALLTAAGTLHDGKKADEALVLYKQAAADMSIPADLRGLAALAAIQLDTALTADEKQAALEKIYAEADNPWAPYARLEAATLLASGGDYKGARDHLSILEQTKDIPDSLYQKAAALAHVYRLKSQDAPALAPEAGTEGDKG